MPCCDQEPESDCCEPVGDCPTNAAGRCVLEAPPPPGALVPAVGCGVTSLVGETVAIPVVSGASVAS